MEVSTTSPNNTVVQSESLSSSESSHSKVTKDLGNIKLSKESQSFESSELERKVEQSVKSTGSTHSSSVSSVQSSCVVQSSSSVQSSRVQSSSVKSEEDEAKKIENGHAEESEISETKQNGHERIEQNGTETVAESQIYKPSGPVGTKEIQQESIKTTLKEIINEIDQAMAGQEQDGEPIQETKETTIPELTSDKKSENLSNLNISNSFNYTRPSQCSQSPTEETSQFRSSLLAAVISETLPNPVLSGHMTHNGTDVVANGHTANNDQSEDTEDPYVPKPKPIDLEKIFTPATDAEEIKPNPNRTMYASSSFYSKALHPTVEEQVKLAHKISSSLSDSSNTTSKGQSMYLNRKKRSVQWVHEKNGQQTSGSTVESESNVSDRPPPPLKLLMNPYGKVQDVNSIRRQTGVEPLSPDLNTFNVVSALNANKGRGAELFAKRRKKSENWIVNEVKTTQKMISRENSVQQNYGTPLPKLPPLFEDNLRPQPQYRPEQTQFENYKLTTSETSSTGSQYWDSSKDHLYKPKAPQAWGKAPQQTNYNGNSFKAPAFPQRNYSSPAQNNYAPPAQNNYAPPAQNYSLPAQNNYVPAKQPPPPSPAPAPTSLLTTLAPVQSNPTFSWYQCNNYNTAPRGWGQVKDYYRPVTFDSKHAPCTGY